MPLAFATDGEGEITATVFGPDGTYVIAASTNGTVATLDTTTGRRVSE